MNQSTDTCNNMDDKHDDEWKKSGKIVSAIHLHEAQRQQPKLWCRSQDSSCLGKMGFNSVQLGSNMWELLGMMEMFSVSGDGSYMGV